MSGHSFLYVIWKNPRTKRNYIVGKLEKAAKGFSFEYCDEYKDALNDGWSFIESFPEDKKYESNILFPVFQSRLPDRKRKDLPQILKKYGLDNYDGFELLKNSGGRLPIDTFEFIDPIFDDDKTIERSFYLVVFHDLSLCKGHNCNERPFLKGEMNLILSREEDNPFDKDAVCVKTQEGEYLGYIPRYYSKSVSSRLDKGMSYSCTVLEIENEGNCEECIKVQLVMPKKENQ